jgi:hypothetical protein
MPNHCENTLGVAGGRHEVIKFINLVTNAEGKIEIFNYLKPTPSELLEKEKVFTGETKDEDLVALYGYDNWYDWRNSVWGTKWGDYETSCTEIYATNSNPDIYYCHFHYLTAWGPGEEFLAEQLPVQFPELTFNLYYREPGMGFHGQVFISKGNLVLNKSAELTSFDDDIVDAMNWLQ